MSTRIDTRILRTMQRALPDIADDWLHGVAIEIVDDIRLSMSENGPSAPGEPPAVDTGRHRASIQSSRVRRLLYYVYDGTEYGLMLERGTSRMAPRPHFAPVFIEWQQNKFRQAANDLTRRIRGLR